MMMLYVVHREHNNRRRGETIKHQLESSILEYENCSIVECSREIDNVVTPLHVSQFSRLQWLKR